MSTMTPSQAFRDIRLALGWSQTDAAHKLGAHQPGVSCFERGKFMLPQLFVIARYAEAEGLEPEAVQVLKDQHALMGLGHIPGIHSSKGPGAVTVQLPVDAPKTRALLEALAEAGDEIQGMTDNEFREFLLGYMEDQ